MQNSINLLWLTTLLATSLSVFSQSGVKKNIRFELYSHNPWQAETRGENPPSPVKIIILTLKEVEPKNVNDSSVTFSDRENKYSLRICKSVFNADHRVYNFEKSLIDNTIAFGHDGFSSLEYVKNNFQNELSCLILTSDSIKGEKNFKEKGFPVFLHPHLADEKGNCSIRLFSVKNHFRYLIVIKGGDGAGAYETYVLLDLFNRSWIFFRDMNTDIVTFVPFPHKKDPFSKHGEKIWYKVYIDENEHGE